MSGYGKKETWKVVYVPKVMNNGYRGVALVEAETRQLAINAFMRENAGQYHTIEECKKLLG